MSTPSERSRRWLWPPPQRTAYLSSTRSPGTVLRVSRIWARVPCTASTNLRVKVAMPPRRCRTLRITRSQQSSTRALWRITAIACPLCRRTPSKTSPWLMTSGWPIICGSSCSYTSRMRLIAPTPARMQSCLARIVAVARCCESMQAREVASLVALSSSNACSKMAEILRLCQSIHLRRRALALLRKDIQHEDDCQQEHQRDHRICQLVDQQPVEFASASTQKSRARPIDELGKSGNHKSEPQPAVECFVNEQSDCREDQSDEPIES